MITDHIRSATFMICDGVLPSNEGRGYVLRRLLRRAARHGKLLGVNDPFLYQVCDTVIHENEGHYPELRERQDYITKVIRVEEENFAKTIDGGLQHLQRHARRPQGEGGAGVLRRRRLQALRHLRLPHRPDHGDGGRAGHGRWTRTASTSSWRSSASGPGRPGRPWATWAGPAWSSARTCPRPSSWATPRTPSPAPSVVALVVENEQAEELMPGVEGIVVLDKTPFYAEMGGQVADHGTIARSGENGCLFQVTDVQKNKGGKYMHYGKVTEGVLKLGDTVTAAIDAGPPEGRHARPLRHPPAGQGPAHRAGGPRPPGRLPGGGRPAALRLHPLLRHDRPRSWPRSAAWSTRRCWRAMTSRPRSCPSRRPRRPGAIALFGEKYGDSVRVVDMGEGYSVEFCGGTHLDNTAKVGVFHIKSEFSVASGVRRIEATTGRASLEVMNRNQELLFQAAAALKAKPGELREKAEHDHGRAASSCTRRWRSFKAREAAERGGAVPAWPPTTWAA